MSNPCIGCKESWSAEGNLSCHDMCDKYQIYKDGKKLTMYFNSEIKGNCIDWIEECRSKFFQEVKDLKDSEIIIVYKFVEFMKKQC